MEIFQVRWKVALIITHQRFNFIVFDMPVRNTITQHCSTGKATFEGEKVEIHYFLLMMLTNHLIQHSHLKIQPASKLSGALWGWGGKGRRPCKTTSLEFEYLHRENRCEMLIGEDDITNDVITSFGTCFSMFVYIRARYCFALIGGNLITQSTASHRGIGG